MTSQSAVLRTRMLILRGEHPTPQQQRLSYKASEREEMQITGIGRTKCDGWDKNDEYFESSRLLIKIVLKKFQ